MNQGPAKTIQKKSSSTKSAAPLANLCHDALLKGLIENGESAKVIKALQESAEGQEALDKYVKSEVKTCKLINVVKTGADSTVDGTFVALDLAELPKPLVKIFQTYIELSDEGGRHGWGLNEVVDYALGRSRAGGWQVEWQEKSDAITWCFETLGRMSVSRTQNTLRELGLEAELNDEVSLVEAWDEWFEENQEDVEEALETMLDDVFDDQTLNDWTNKRNFYGKNGGWQQEKPYIPKTVLTLIIDDANW